MGHKLRRITDLSRFTHLIRLDLSDNILRSCEGLEVLASSLRHLDLSQNRIESLTPLLRLTNLQVLDLSNNQITDIPSKISSLSSLTTLHLDSNKIKDISALVPLRTSLMHLSLTGNTITDYVDFVLRSNFPRLETLDESYLDRDKQEDNVPKSGKHCLTQRNLSFSHPRKTRTSEAINAISTARKSAMQAAKASSLAADRSSLAATHALKAQQITVHTQVTSMTNRLNLLRERDAYGRDGT